MNRKTFLASLGLGAVAAATYLLSPTSKQKTIEDFLEDNGFTIKVLPNLVVNMDNSFVSVVDKDEVQGIENLLELIIAAPAEEIYAYLPAEHKFIELGLATTIPHKEGNQIKEGCYFNEELVRIIAQQYHHVHYYHIHRTAQAVLGNRRMSIGAEDTPAEKKRKRDKRDFRQRYVYSPQENLPSIADILSMSNLLVDHNSQNPESKALFRICTQYGVVEYSLTPQGLELFKQLPEQMAMAEIESVADKMRRRYTRLLFKVKGEGEFSLFAGLTLPHWRNTSLRASLYHDRYLKVDYYSYAHFGITPHGDSDSVTYPRKEND